MRSCTNKCPLLIFQVKYNKGQSNIYWGHQVDANGNCHLKSLTPMANNDVKRFCPNAASKKTVLAPWHSITFIFIILFVCVCFDTMRQKINCDNSFLFCCYCFCFCCSYVISSHSICCSVYAWCQKFQISNALLYVQLHFNYCYSSENIAATAFFCKSSPWLQCNRTKCPPHGRSLWKKYSLHAWSDEKQVTVPCSQ